MVLKFVTHSKRVQQIASKHGWLPGARYTNMRDIRHQGKVEFIDIDWKKYDFDRHLFWVKTYRPMMTVAQDIYDVNDIDEILSQAEILSGFCHRVVVVPKDPLLSENLERRIPSKYVLGFSVPTKYGGTSISTSRFRRPVHLLGGRPDVQRKLADNMAVYSIDCNRFTLDASFGDYFNGSHFVPHPTGGYENCIDESLRNINLLWLGYRAAEEFTPEAVNSS